MITPIDLENKEFTKSFRGYNPEEVQEFLDEVCKDYGKIYRENASMKDKNAILNDAVENYKGMEETMRSAIISAQKTSEEIIRNAHEQAEAIVQNAKNRAQEILNNMDGQIQNLKRECAEIEGYSNLLRAKLRAVLNTYLGILDELPKETENKKETAAETVEKESTEE